MFMGLLTSILGSSGDAIAKPIDAIGNTVDRIFTSDEERANSEIEKEKLRQKAAEQQVSLNKVEATHKSIFVAGWRPFIGWTCGIGLFYDVLLMPILNGVGCNFERVDSSAIHSIVASLLGLAFLRSGEKAKGIHNRH